MIAPITNKENISTLMSMKHNKSSNPDGFNVNFFIHCWNVIGADCHMPLGFNATAFSFHFGS